MAHRQLIKRVRRLRQRFNRLYLELAQGRNLTLVEDILLARKIVEMPEFASKLTHIPKDYRNEIKESVVNFARECRMERIKLEAESKQAVAQKDLERYQFKYF